MEIPKEDYDNLKSNLDQMFLIIMGMIVLLMQCGFAFLEAGAVRSKNSTNILIKNLLDSFIAGVSYWLFGYPFAFGSGNTFIGHTFWASSGLPSTDFAFFFFQYVFAATAATIVSGAMAERCEFVAYFIYSFVLTGFIYPVVTHWVWSTDGWLVNGMEYSDGNSTFTMGYQDFAGSGVVHVVGGTAAFVGAIMLGPRMGRFLRSGGVATSIRGHSVPLAALGGFILVFGFLAFNGGSELSISKAKNGEHISLAVVNTIISASVSAFVSLFVNKTLGTETWSLLLTLNGALTGMVAVCAGCNVYYPWGAAIVGFLAAFSYVFWSRLVLHFRIDDPLDAVAVHFGGGSLGVIAVAFLKKDEGILFKWDRQSGLFLAWQLAGLVSITAWTGVLCLLMFGTLRLCKILRVSQEIEKKGLDIPKHGEPAYPKESYGHGWMENFMDVHEVGALSQLSRSNKGGSMQGLASAFQREISIEKREPPRAEVVGHSNPAVSIIDEENYHLATKDQANTEEFRNYHLPANGQANTEDPKIGTKFVSSIEITAM